MRRWPLPRRTALTLVELVVAVALFGAILASVGGLVLATARVQHMAADAPPSTRPLAQALQLIERDVRAAKPHAAVPVRMDGGRLELARVGGPPHARSWARVVYRVRDGHLIREAWRLEPEGAEGPRTEETLLAMGAVRFVAGARQATDGQLVWLDAWDGETQGIPRLVQVTCALPAQPGVPSWSLARAVRNPAGTLPVVGDE